MATIDLTLDALKIPNINGTFPFGKKITQTELNHGGLSTTEVNSNVMLPFTQMRPKICDEDSDTSQVEYDAKVVFNAPQGTTPAAGYTLTMGNGTYVGCTVTYTNLMEYACTVKQSDGTTTLFSVPAGKTMSAMWNGTAWLWTTTGSVTANDPTPVSSAAVQAAIGNIRFTSLADVDVDQNIDYLTAAARSYTMPGNGLLVAKIIKASSGYTFTLRVNGVIIDSLGIYESYSGNVGFELKAFVKKNDVVSFWTDAPNSIQCKINKMVLLRYEAFITN